MPNNHLEIMQFVNEAALEMAVEEVENLEDLQDRLSEVAWRIAEDAKSYWQDEAGRYLHTTLQRYQRALYIFEDFAEGGVVVGMSTDDPLVVAIEEGRPAFDMKQKLLGGAVRRVIPINPPRDMRTVTAGQDSSKWQHPGFVGLNLVESTDNYIEDVLVPKYMTDLFESL